MVATARLTPKGAATRARIVATAADLILARGVGSTSLDDIRAGTATSKVATAATHAQPNIERGRFPMFKTD